MGFNDYCDSDKVTDSSLKSLVVQNGVHERF